MNSQEGAAALIRPGTLQEAIRLSGDNWRRFNYGLAGFLDAFYLDTRRLSRRDRVEDDPGITGSKLIDALVGAIAEHLCERWYLGPPPDWSQHDVRILHRPVFLGLEGMKPFYLEESPTAFRRRFIFTEGEPLRRATMPRDETWWAFETLRTGIEPQGPDDIAPPAWAGP